MGSDPTDDLGVLKAAIGIVSDLGLANFYDPREPRRDLQCLFKEYKADRSIITLHIGIYYYETADEPAKTGHLYIVKNRLPPSHEGKKVEPHITQEEMIGACERGKGPSPLGDKMFDPEVWHDVNTDQLGSLCCCDCSHTNGVRGDCAACYANQRAWCRVGKSCGCHRLGGTCGRSTESVHLHVAELNAANFGRHQ